MAKLYPVYHAGGCEKIAFYTDVVLNPFFDSFSSEHVIRLDGSKPIDFVDKIECGTCGNLGKYLDDELVYDGDIPVEVVFQEQT